MIGCASARDAAIAVSHTRAIHRSIHLSICRCILIPLRLCARRSTKTSSLGYCKRALAKPPKPNSSLTVSTQSLYVCLCVCVCVCVLVAYGVPGHRMCHAYTRVCGNASSFLSLCLCLCLSLSLSLCLCLCLCLCVVDGVSGPFARFLDVLGDRVELKGWQKYRGGLDVTGVWKSQRATVCVLLCVCVCVCVCVCW
jgi:hypothetical protein